MRKPGRDARAAAALAAALGCTGQISGSVPISVSVAPPAATVSAGATAQFSAAVAGTRTGAVTWTVSGAARGSIASNGLYSAPASVDTSMTDTIVATSQLDGKTFGHAVVTVTPAGPTPIVVTVVPSKQTVVAGHTFQFQANVTGAANSSVTWSVSGNAKGTISSGGVYAAPASVAAAATDTVVATSQADGKTTGQAVVTVTPASSTPIAVTITPVAPTVAAGHTVQLRADVTGTSNSSVTWSVSGAAKGTISSSGLYTAPASIAATAADTVIATSQADGATTGQVTVYVTQAGVGVTAMPIISRGKPAFASSGTASDGNSADYGKVWKSDGQPAWLAYDLSSVPVSQRKQVIAYWVAPGVDTYDMTVLNNRSYDLAGPYVIEANSAAGGASSAPSSGWVALVDRSGVPQNFKSGQFPIDLTGYNWIRFRTTGPNPRNESGAAACRLKLDVYDAHLGVTDDWIFFGDSISGMAWHDPVCFFSTLITAAKPAFTPLSEGGGVAFLTSGMDPSIGGGYFILNRWLALFPGKFVVLAFGSNDCNGGAVWDDSKRAAVYKNYKAMVQAIVAAGKTPIIGTTIWAASAANQACLLKYNELLGIRPQDTSPAPGTIACDFPQVVKGPDLYGAFKDHPEWLGDGLHPNDTGFVQYKKAWADWALANIYP
jgi:hypothetical protein